ncbi:hypothetical protein [Pseudomonas taetrolens]|uniref:hypothetical protein n=1 Tax=Pseudomonas taetrolens TaxID=47884 RepID=UPI003F9A2C2B
MGILLISKDTVAPWNTKVIAPVTRGLEAWFTFDTDASRFGFNRAPNKPDASIVGTPIAFPTHGRFTSLSNFIQTQVMDSAKVTIIAVGRSPVPIADPAPTPDTRPIYASTFSGPSITPGITGNSTGVTLYPSAAASLASAAARSNGSGGVTVGTTTAEDDPTSWGIRVLRASDTEGTLVQNITRGTKTIGSVVTQRALNANKFRIGSALSQFLGEIDISSIAIYSEALTDEEIALIADRKRIRMQRLGIPV